MKTSSTLVLLTTLSALAQPTGPVTIAGAVEQALKNYPSIQVSQEQLNAASAAIALARTAYLPHVDALAQANRSTRNNVFGLLLPQTVIPSISGPVLGTNNTGTAWGSALGTLVSWEPFDFGLRRANVAVAQAGRTQAEAALKRTQFEVAVTAADAYLTLIASQETVRAAQAGVDRAETVQRTIQALVDAELRPGAESSRAQAEVAAARTQLIQAEQARDVARSTLSRFTGSEPAGITTAAAKLLELPPEAEPGPLNIAANPLVVEQNAAVQQVTAQLRALERSYFPRFNLQGSAYARGTGAELDGRLLGGVNGLAPTTQNFALGLTVTFPVLDLPAIRAREAGQAATVRAQAARSRQIAVDLRAQWDASVAMLQGARRVAANAPVQVAAAQSASQQARARYEAGLSNIQEVADAQRLLTQAEIDNALARLGVWRALLGLATAAGDLQPFLSQATP
ncbi:MAG: TolC family protein [Acidobacteriota bacterium]|nr:TolC family protein [Acidobacteriota bacterium]